MFCQHCGKEVPDDARFCLTCGKAIPRPDPQTPAKTPATGLHRQRITTDKVDTRPFVVVSRCLLAGNHDWGGIHSSSRGTDYYRGRLGPNGDDSACYCLHDYRAGTVENLEANPLRPPGIHHTDYSFFSSRVHIRGFFGAHGSSRVRRQSVHIRFEHSRHPVCDAAITYLCLTAGPLRASSIESPRS